MVNVRMVEPISQRIDRLLSSLRFVTVLESLKFVWKQIRTIYALVVLKCLIKIPA